jgi:hypothetical protein
VATADDDDVEVFQRRDHGPDFYRGAAEPERAKCSGGDVSRETG